MAVELSRTRESLDAVLSIDRLLALDDLWTSYLDHADRDDIERNLTDLEALVADMNRGLAAAGNHARAADEQLMNVSDEEVVSAIDRLLQDQANDWPSCVVVSSKTSPSTAHADHSRRRAGTLTWRPSKRWAC